MKKIAALILFLLVSFAGIGQNYYQYMHVPNRNTTFRQVLAPGRTIIFQADSSYLYQLDTTSRTRGVALETDNVDSLYSNGWLMLLNGGEAGSITWPDTITNIATLYDISQISQGTITLTTDVTGSGTGIIVATVVDDSHNHIIGNVDDLQAELDQKRSLSNHDSIAELDDADISSPVADQVLAYNGTQWYNANPAIVAGTGVEFFFDSTHIIFSGVGPQTKGLESLLKVPSQAAETDEDVIVNTNTLLIDRYLFDDALGGSVIDAGKWTFDIYNYVSSANGVTTMPITGYRVIAGDGTVTITGTGTSRTATVTAGTPFLAGDANADITLAGWLQTENAQFQITGYTSTSVVTIECLTTYTNEVGSTYSNHRWIWYTPGMEIDNLAIALNSFTLFDSAHVINPTDKLAVSVFGKKVGGPNTTVHFIYGGTEHYSHFTTPLIMRHNDLSGLQGGTADERVHLDSTETELVQNIDDPKYIVQQANSYLNNEQAMGALATGMLKNTTTTGVLSIGAVGTDYANGTGTTNMVPKWTGTGTLGESQLFDDGTTVALGTVSPNAGYAFHIDKTIGNILVQSNTDTYAAYAGFFNAASYLFVGMNNNTGIQIMNINGIPYAGVISTEESYPLQLGTKSEARLTIDTIGRVGIDTIAPTEKLHVNGRVRIDTIPVRANVPTQFLADSSGMVVKYPYVAGSVVTPANVTEGSTKIDLGGTPTGAALQAFSIDVDETKIDHDNLLNYTARRHFTQPVIDTVNPANQGILKADANGVLSAATAGVDYSTPDSNQWRLDATTGRIFPKSDKSIEFVNTSSSSTGVIYKGNLPFIHNYESATPTGKNTFIGESAGNFTMDGSGNQASYNTIVGSDAFQNNTTGATNMGVGWEALKLNTTGFNNSAIGSQSMNTNTTGHSNIANGTSSLRSNTTGFYNTGIGYAASFANSTGWGNTAVGSWTGGALTTGSVNIFIGDSAGTNASQKVDAVNSMALGSYTYTTASNQFVYGNSSVTRHEFNGGSVFAPDLAVSTGDTSVGFNPLTGEFYAKADVAASTDTSKFYYATGRGVVYNKYDVPYGFNKTTPVARVDVVGDAGETAVSGVSTGNNGAGGYFEMTGVESDGTGYALYAHGEPDGGGAYGVWAQSDSSAGIALYATSQDGTALSVAGRANFSDYIEFDQAAAPSPTTDRLYNVSGDLFWNGTEVGAATSGNIADGDTTNEMAVWNETAGEYQATNYNGLNFDATTKSLYENSKKIINHQEINNTVADGKGMWFDGDDDYVSLGTDTELDLGTGDGSYFVRFKNTGNDGAVNGFFDVAGTDRQRIDISTGGNLYIYMAFGGTSIANTGDTDIGVDGLVHSAAYTIDRSSVTGLNIYLDGKIDATPVDATDIEGDAVVPTGTKYIGSNSSGSDRFFAGDIYDFKYFNLNLSASEVLALSEGGAVDYKYTGASNAALVTGTDSDMSGAGNWVGLGLTDQTGSANGTFNVNDEVAGKLYMIGDGSNDAVYLASKVLAGKMYRVTLKARLNTGASTTIYCGRSVTVSDTEQYFSFTPTGTEATYTGTFIPASDGAFIIGAGTPGFTGIAFEIDDVTLIRIGEVLSLDPAGMSTATWYDQSGNSIDGTVSGAVVNNMPEVTVISELKVEGGSVTFDNNSPIKFKDTGGTPRSSFLLDASDNIRMQSAAGKDLVFHTGSTEHIRILSGGNVGIGTTAPSAILEVDGQKTTSNLLEVVNDNDGAYGDSAFKIDKLGNLHSLRTFNTEVTASEIAVFIDNTGKMGYSTSTKAAKEKIKPMENINWLYKLRPVNFIYKSDSSKWKRYGFIAEEVDSVNSNLVLHETQPGTVSGTIDTVAKTVFYERFIAVLVKALQNHKEELDALNPLISISTITTGGTATDTYTVNDTTGIPRKALASSIYYNSPTAIDFVAGYKQIGNGRYDGQIISITSFKNNYTITLDQGDNIKLDEGVTWVGGKGDEIVLKWVEGLGNWYERSRSNN